MLCFFRDEINANCTVHAKYSGLLSKLRSETTFVFYEDKTYDYATYQYEKEFLLVKEVEVDVFQEFHSINL